MSQDMKAITAKLTGRKLIDLKKAKVRMEHDVVSIKERLRDIEWRIEGGELGDQLMTERQSAMDKLRHTQKELLLVREELIEAGAE